MSQLLINRYLNELATLRRVSGDRRESVVRVTASDGLANVTTVVLLGAVSCPPAERPVRATGRSRVSPTHRCGRRPT